jgi:hypothetical protein
MTPRRSIRLPEGASLRSAQVGPDLVVIVHVALHDPAKLLLAGDDDVIETFSPDRTDHPFNITVLPLA